MRQKLRQGTRRSTTGQHGRGATPGERRGDLLGAAPGPGPDRQPSTACKFVLPGLANHAGPDGTRRSCHAVGLHLCQFIGAIAVPRSPSVKALILRAAMNRA